MSFSVLFVVAMLSLGQAQSQAPAQGTDENARQGTAATATPAAEPEAEPPTVDPDAIGVSLDKIQKAVLKPPAIKLSGERQVFRIEVFGKNPTIADILGPDYLRGPVPYSGMTHQEFLDMVTPKDVQGYAPFSNQQGAVVAATSLAFAGLVWTVQKALDKYKDARTERARAAAEKEVQEALDALRKARRDAGLPDK